MNKTKKLLISFFVLLFFISSFILFKLSTSGLKSEYIKEKLSLYILDFTEIYPEIPSVYIKISKDRGLFFKIPTIKSVENLKFNFQDTTIDIDILSILKNGIYNSDIFLDSNIDTHNNKSISIEVFANSKNFTIKKISSEDFYIIDDVDILKDELNKFNVSFKFSKNFIKSNFAQYIDSTISNYNLNLADLFFEDNTFYKASIVFDFKNQNININELENKHLLKFQTLIDYSKNDKIINLDSIIPSKNLSQIIEIIASNRDTKNRRILKIISDLSKEDQKVNVKFMINDDLEPRNIRVTASGKLDFNYKFDQNDDPSLLQGESSYDIALYKENVTDDFYNISSNIDLTDTFLYFRQINLTKKPKEALNLTFNTYFDLKKNIEVNIKSSESNPIIINGKIELSERNDLAIKNFFISNNSNVNLKINGFIENRNFSGKILGKKIDLSKNKIEINDNLKNYYFASEKYKIFINEALLLDGLLASNFKADIDKEKNQIDIQASGKTMETSFTYSRKKNKKIDVSIIKTDNITNSVGPNHGSRKIIKNGKANISSYRVIGSLDTNVEVELKDFVLINTPGTLKLLSLPSTSGIRSLINNERGIEFAYGKINYKVNENNYFDINAYAVNDGVGLILNGSIDRKKRSLNLKGQISPLHLISGLIQKIPIFGKLLIGNEGEGIIAVEYIMTGNQDDPDVSSNPLTIFKPRLFERTFDFFNKNL